MLMVTFDNLQINCNFMIAQGNDRATTIGGWFHGLQQYITEIWLFIIIVHLNFAFSDALELHPS